MPSPIRSKLTPEEFEDFLEEIDRLIDDAHAIREKFAKVKKFSCSGVEFLTFFNSCDRLRVQIKARTTR